MKSIIRRGSIDPIIGIAKTYRESSKIEEEFCKEKNSIYINIGPNLLFSITVNFKKPFYQTTQCFGTKPEGYRSVFRGESISIYGQIRNGTRMEHSI